MSERSRQLLLAVIIAWGLVNAGYVAWLVLTLASGTTTEPRDLVNGFFAFWNTILALWLVRRLVPHAP